MAPPWTSRPIQLLLMLLLVVMAALLLFLPPLGDELVLLGMAGALGGADPTGGASARPDPAKSPHAVVDTLNATHALLSRGGRPCRLHRDDIVRTIDTLAPLLKKRHAGTVVFVVKERDSLGASAETETDVATTNTKTDVATTNTKTDVATTDIKTDVETDVEALHASLQDAATRNGVTVAVAERYRGDPPRGVPISRAHAAQGRDDFLMALYARKLRCAVVTNDRLRDFAEFRRTLQPFRVFEFTYWRDRPHLDFIRPESPAYARLPRPRTVPVATYLTCPG